MKKILLMLFLLIQATLSLTAQESKSTKKSALIKVEGSRISLKHGLIELDKNGFPKQIQSSYNPSINAIKLLYENIHFHFVRKSDGKNVLLKDGGVRFSKNDKGDQLNRIVRWETTNRNDSLVMDVTGKLKFDGQLKYKVKVTALHDIALKDVTMHIPFIPTLPTLMVGLGVPEAARPEIVEWHWGDTYITRPRAWLGNVDAGLEYTLQKGAWANENKGGVTIGIKGSSMLANNYSGEREMKKGDVLHFDFTLFVKPSRNLVNF